MPIGVDANIPFMEAGPGLAIDARTGLPAMDYNIRFLHRMDERLRAAGLRHGDPVVLLCRSGERSRLAAELMREHGYLQVFVVQGGFEGALASGTEEGEGWKSAGLPWTARIDPGWLYADAPASLH
jgi:rhodanese-related sulfurtransferase